MSTHDRRYQVRLAAVVILTGWTWSAPRLAAADPTIAITSLPAYGANGLVQGVVGGVAVGSYRVAPYIYVDGLGWWTKPTFASPTLPINGDGTFAGNVFTGGLDTSATIFCVALLPSGVTPPAASGSGRVPDSLDFVAMNCRERFGRTIAFAGRKWAVKEAGLPVGPGGNRFSDQPGDVWVDGEGLHLTVRQRDGHWWSTEVILLDRLGYGTYVFKTRSRTDILDSNATLGLFTWDSYGDGVSPGSPNREIDFEDSRWGVATDPNTQAVVQPWDVTGNRHRFHLPDLSSDPRLTRIFDWKPKEIEFLTLAGHQPAKGYPASAVIDDWVYQQETAAGHYVPEPSRETVRINLWLNQTSPANGQTIEVIITDFSFIPRHAERLDFNGDGLGDIALQDSASTWVAGWLADRNGRPNGFFPVYFDNVGEWQVVAHGDLNQDGVGDIILQHSTLTWVGAWLLDPAGRPMQFVPVYFADTGGWKVVAMADLNGDAISDVVLQHAGLSWVGGWLMNGANTPTAFVPVYFADVARWRVVAAADLNGDDISDLILQNGDNTWVAAWLMNAAGRPASFLPIYFSDIGDWQVVDSIDLNGNGVTDLLLQHRSTTWVGAWLMDGSGRVSSFLPVYLASTGTWMINGRK